MSWVMNHFPSSGSTFDNSGSLQDFITTGASNGAPFYPRQCGGRPAELLLDEAAPQSVAGKSVAGTIHVTTIPY